MVNEVKLVVVPRGVDTDIGQLLAIDLTSAVISVGDTTVIFAEGTPLNVTPVAFYHDFLFLFCSLLLTV